MFYDFDAPFLAALTPVDEFFVFIREINSSNRYLESFGPAETLLKWIPRQNRYETAYVLMHLCMQQSSFILARGSLTKYPPYTKPQKCFPADHFEWLFTQVLTPTHFGKKCLAQNVFWKGHPWARNARETKIFRVPRNALTTKTTPAALRARFCGLLAMDFLVFPGRVQWGRNGHRA